MNGILSVSLFCEVCCVRNEHRFVLGSKLLLSNALSMLNKNLTGFVQSLFSVQSICTVRKGSASRVPLDQKLKT